MFGLHQLITDADGVSRAEGQVEMQQGKGSRSWLRRSGSVCRPDALRVETGWRMGIAITTNVGALMVPRSGRIVSPLSVIECRRRLADCTSRRGNLYYLRSRAGGTPEPFFVVRSKVSICPSLASRRR